MSTTVEHVAPQPAPQLAELAFFTGRATHRQQSGK